MPHLKELHEKHGDDLVLIGVHSTNGAERMAEFVEDEEIPYPVAVDVDRKTVTAFGGNSYPDYFVIDRKGILRFADLANAQLAEAVAALVAEPAPDTPAE